MSGESRRLRVAIVGCGRMGTERARACSVLDTSVIACVDAQSSRADNLALQHVGTVAVSDLNDLPWSELDAVFVCTPPSERFEIVNRAIQVGVSLMVEKPIGLSAVDGQGYANAARKAGIINAVGYMNRCRASVRRAREILGRHSVVAVICHWASKQYGVPWWSEPTKSGGPFNEQATHMVDLCRFLIGEIKSVEAIGGPTPPGNLGTTRVAVALQFSAGAVGTLCYTCEAPDKFIGFEAVTNAGRLRLEGWEFALSANSIDGQLCGPEPDVFKIETGAFLQAVADKNQLSVGCSFEDAVSTQTVVDDILETIHAKEGNR